MSIDVETKRRIADYFEGFELVEYLQIPIDVVIEEFEDEIEEALDDIEELMGVKNGESSLSDRFAP